MTCKQIRHCLDDAFDRDNLQNLPEKAALHLQTCPHCRFYWESLQALDLAIQQLERCELPPKVPATGWSHPRRSHAVRPTSTGRKWILAAAAAVLLLCGGLGWFRWFAASSTDAPPLTQTEIFLEEVRVENQPTPFLVYRIQSPGQGYFIVWMF